MMFKRMMMAAIVVTCATGLAFAAPGDPGSSVLINQYNGALPDGGGSSNIVAVDSSNLGPPYAGEWTVDGGFRGANPGPKGEAGGDLQANGFYGHTTDPDPYMWITSHGTDKVFTGFIKYSFDNSYDFDWMQVWNQNEITPNVGGDRPTGRGSKNAQIWYSDAVDAPGTGMTAAGEPDDAGWLGGQAIELSEGPGTGDYTGQTVDLNNFTARHILFEVDTQISAAPLAGQSNGPFAGLSEIQFYSVPEPASFTMLLAGIPLMFVISVWNQRRR